MYLISNNLCEFFIFLLYWLFSKKQVETDVEGRRFQEFFNTYNPCGHTLIYRKQ